MERRLVSIHRARNVHTALQTARASNSEFNCWEWKQIKPCAGTDDKFFWGRHVGKCPIKPVSSQLVMQGCKAIRISDLEKAIS